MTGIISWRDYWGGNFIVVVSTVVRVIREKEGPLCVLGQWGGMKKAFNREKREATTKTILSKSKGLTCAKRVHGWPEERSL